MSTSEKESKRSFDEQRQYLTNEPSMRYGIDMGFVSSMKVHGYVLVNDEFEYLLVAELRPSIDGSKGGPVLLPAWKHSTNVAASIGDDVR